MGLSQALKNPFARGTERAKPLPLPDFTADDDDDDDDGEDDGGELVDRLSDEQLIAEALPPAWDFFEVDATKLRTKKANDEPIGIQRIRFQRIVKGERRGIKGEFDARNVNRAWLLREYGPGTYFVTGINNRGTYVVGGRIELEHGSGLHAAPSPLWNPAPNAQGLGAAPDHSALANQIIQAAVQRLMSDQRPPAPAQDPIRESFAAMAKMIQLQMTSMQLASQQNHRETDPLTMMLLKEIISERKTRPEPAAPMEDAFKLVSLGMQLKDLVGGPGGEDGDGPDPWMDILKTAIDRMGPGTVSLLSHAFLPAEHASSVDDMIKAAAGAQTDEK